MRIYSYIALVCILLPGCGMPDYEKRMDAQRARVTEFDEINRLLDEPIEMPSMKKPDGKDEPAWRFDFFLRLPKGYGKLPKDKTPYYDPFPCFRYGTADVNHSIFAVVNLIPDPKGKEQLGEYHKAKFRTFLPLAIADYYAKSTKLKLNLNDKTKPQDRTVTAFSPYPESATKLKYDLISYTDQNNKQVTNPTQFDIYVHESAGKQACIIVQHPVRMQNAEAFNKSIEACLSTLDLSNEAPTKRAQFYRNR